MINTLVGKWVCLSFFQPSTYLETLDSYELSRFKLNPAHVACNGLDTGVNYFITASILIVVIFNVLLFLYSAFGTDFDRAIGWSLLCSIVVGLLWPISTFAVPLSLLGWVSWRLGKS